MILCIKSLNTQSKSRSMNSVKLQDMKLIYQKPVACLYNNDELEREIKKTIQLTTASKRTKYLG